MNLQDFTITFEKMCKEVYPKGANTMEIFMYLSNPNMTLKDIQVHLENLMAKNMCTVTDSKWLYQTPPPKPIKEIKCDASESSVEDSLLYMQTFFEKKFTDLMTIHQQMLDQQKMILESLNKMSVFHQPAPVAVAPQPLVGVPIVTTPVPVVPQPLAAPAQEIKIKSFTGAEEYYSLDLQKMTCSCPNFIHVQSKQIPVGKCKHLIVALDNAGAIGAAQKN